jgi:membrane protein DedA with SNARE-associated domain
MEQLIHLLETYRYVVLFPLAIVEGPVLAVIAGLLCTQGFLNPLIAYPVIVIGDITGDSICYWLGRSSRSVRLSHFRLIRYIGSRLGSNGEKLERLRLFFDVNPIKTISLSKITLGVGIAGIFMAGNAKVPYLRFLPICLVVSAAQYLVYLMIGLLFGRAYIEIGHYLNSIAAACIMLTLGTVGFLFVKSVLKRA